MHRGFYGHMLSFLFSRRLSAVWLELTVDAHLTSPETAKLFLQSGYTMYIPASSVDEFQFFHILGSPCWYDQFLNFSGCVMVFHCSFFEKILLIYF